jgi:tetratricopeptide (TPR) repeat protein
MRKGKLVRDIFGPSIEGPADEIVDDAWDADTPAKRVKLARKALDVDLNAIDAYVILGLYATTTAEKIALLREADRIGTMIFAPLLDDPEMHWWGFIGTRPWMRARHNLALALMDAEEFEDAIETLRSLIELNENDNQGIRYLLLKIYAQIGRYDECKILFERYQDDCLIEFPSTRLLIELDRARPKKNLQKLLVEVDESNTHFLSVLKRAALTGRWPAPAHTDSITLGSAQQAELCVSEFRQAWTRKPRILENFLSIPEIESLDIS